MRYVLAIAAGLLAAPCAATIVLPTSYEMRSPDNGTFNYQDDSYNGTNTGGFLSGGTGDLTDGVIAGAHWNVTPGPWVGWFNVNPVIVFRFAPGTMINTIDFYFDDARGSGAVTLPQGVQLSHAGITIDALPTITTNDIVGRYSYNIGGLAVDALSATLLRNTGWTMLSEVTFSGTVSAGPPAAVPEPASWAMLILGFGFVGGAMRKRARLELTAVS